MENSYYQQLVARECEHIRQTVGITVHEGHTITTIRNGERTVVHSPISASEAAAQKVADDHKLTESLKHCVEVNPDTGHAHNLSFLTQHCRDIVEIPCSYQPLASAIFSIGETASATNYPDEDRSKIISAFINLTKHRNMDNCTCNELDRAVHKMRQAKQRYAPSANNLLVGSAV